MTIPREVTSAFLMVLTQCTVIELELDVVARWRRRGAAPPGNAVDAAAPNARASYRSRGRFARRRSTQATPEAGRPSTSAAHRPYYRHGGVAAADVLAATRFGMARTKKRACARALSASRGGSTGPLRLSFSSRWDTHNRLVRRTREAERGARRRAEKRRVRAEPRPQATNRGTQAHFLQLGGMVGRSLKEAQSGKATSGPAARVRSFVLRANQFSPRCYPGRLSLSRSIGDVTLKYHPKRL